MSQPSFGIIIPARYGSTRFPGKPLAMIHGKTMIQRTVEAAQTAHPNAGVAVATDDPRIAEICESFATVVMTHSQHISGTDRCADALSQLKWDCEVIVNLQGDEPFIQSEQINSLVQSFTNPSVDIATLKKELIDNADIENPNVVKVVSGINQQALYFSRSPIPFLRDKGHAKHFKHIGMYAFRPSILHQITNLLPTPLEKSESLEQLRWLENGFRIQVIETHWASPAIDTPEDLERVLKNQII